MTLTYDEAIKILQPIMDIAYTQYPQRGDFGSFIDLLPPVTARIVNIEKLAHQVCNGGWTQWIDNCYHLRANEAQDALIGLNTDASRETARLIDAVRKDTDGFRLDGYDEDDLNDAGAMMASGYDYLNDHDDAFYKVDQQLVIDLVVLADAAMVELREKGWA
jgi:hypothetical protein